MAENAFSLDPGQGGTPWLKTPISHFQLNLEYFGDIFQASQDVSTQNISEMANSGQVSSALLICVWEGGGGVHWDAVGRSCKVSGNSVSHLRRREASFSARAAGTCCGCGLEKPSEEADAYLLA